MVQRPKLQFKSPAEFFANNKAIAGFDNPGKSLYTSIRELVENSLDASESIGKLPEVSVAIKEVDKANFRLVSGFDKVVRKHEEIYKYKTSNPVEEETYPAKNKEKDKKTLYYQLTVRDNGCGMPHEDIPNMFGRVLSGTKYCVRQNRGRFGLGAKMVLIWSKMSTSQPICILSSTGENEPVSKCVLDINIVQNVPNILVHEKLENQAAWRGSEITVLIEGSWTPYRSKVLAYMRQLAVITPYAEFTLSFDSACDEKKSFTVRYARRTDYMPPPPLEVKHHPSSINLIILKQLLEQVSNSTLVKALRTQFSSISSDLASKIISELGLDSHFQVSSLTKEHYLQLHSLFKEVKFPDPSPECLSPAGEYNLRLGVIKELKPDMVATSSEPADVVGGHPFIVEAAVSLGGRSVETGVNIYRFANRIPLLFEPGSDIIRVVALNQIKWNLYKINPNSDKVGVFVSLVSTKIPFKGTGKEYIGDDDGRIGSVVKRAIQQCCAQLRTKITRRLLTMEKQNRKTALSENIPPVSKALFSILNKITEVKEQALSATWCVSCSDEAKTRLAPSDLLKRVSREEITEKTLKRRLAEYVSKLEASDLLEGPQEEAQQERLKLYVAYFDLGREPMLEMQSDKFIFYAPKWLFS